MSIFDRILRRTRTNKSKQKLGDALAALESEVVSTIPAHRTTALLEVRYQHPRLEHSLTDGETELPHSTSLAERCQEVYLLMAAQGERWNMARFRYEKDDERWQCNAEFDPE